MPARVFWKQTSQELRVEDPKRTNHMMRENIELRSSMRIFGAWRMLCIAFCEHFSHRARTGPTGAG